MTASLQTEPIEARVARLERINAALIARLDRQDDSRGSAHALFQAAMALEKEVKARNRELERTLADLSRNNRELTQARAAAEEANRSKTRFLRSASHDLVQPLAAAKLFLATLGDTALNADQRDLAARLGAAFASVEELMHAVLDIARLDSPRIEFNRKTVCLDSVLARLDGEFQPIAAARGLQLRVRPSGLCVDTDPTFFFRIAQNLVSNALKYTEKGGVLVGARRRGLRAWLEVRDTGVGIAAGDRDRIFDEFQRLNPDNGRAAGMGLGLSIVRRACLKLGHPITLDSTVGRGSVFRVGLPVVDERPAAEAAPPPCFGRGPDRGALDGRRVLVVENDDAMAHAYRLTLGEGSGMAVRIVRGTGEALALSDAAPPEIILADYHLEHGETGLAAVEVLRARWGGTLPALMVTANRDPALLRAAQTAGIRVLDKPVHPDDLRRALAALIVEDGE